MVKCPVCGMRVDEAIAPSLEQEGKKYFFKSPAHKEMFEQDPGKYVKDDESISGPAMFLDAQSSGRGGCCG